MSELYKLQKLFNYCTLTGGDVYFEYQTNFGYEREKK